MWKEFSWFGEKVRTAARGWEGGKREIEIGRDWKVTGEGIGCDDGTNEV